MEELKNLNEGKEKLFYFGGVFLVVSECNVYYIDG